jgi:hypothetical protein
MAPASAYRGTFEGDRVADIGLFQYADLKVIDAWLGRRSRFIDACAHRLFLPAEDAR